MTRAPKTDLDQTMSTFLRSALASGALAFSGATSALDWEWNGLEARMTNKAAAGASFRVQDRDLDLVGIANGGRAFSTNGDDGNLAWDRGDAVSAGVKLTSDLSLTFGDVGLFVRGSGIYNPVLDDQDYFDDADYGAGKEFGTAEKDRKETLVREHVGADADLLDAYLFGSTTLFGRAVTARVGRQTLNWGEAFLIQHGINALQSFDVNQLRVPGFEIEELAVPVAMAWASLDVYQNVTVDGFYQLDWEPTTIDASGTFWSTNDFAGIGGTQANLGFGRAGENSGGSTVCDPPPGGGSPCVPLGSTVPRAATVEPSDSGQYGGALRLFLPWFNDTDLAVYAMTFHSRLPLFSGTSRSSGGLTPADTANYFVEYPEDIQLYGVSFNTSVELFDIALQGEYSQKIDQPLQVDDVELLLAGLGAAGQISALPGATLGNQYIRGWRRHDVSQVDLSFTKVFTPTFAWDQLSWLFEAGGTYVHDLPDVRDLAYEAPATYTLNPGTAALNAANPSTAGLPVTPYGAYATATSWGYRTAVRFTYNSVFGPWSAEPTLLWQHDVNGTTPTPIVNFVEGRRQATAILSMDYLSTWGVGLAYTNYFGAGDKNLLRDRDFVEVNVKYAF